LRQRLYSRIKFFGFQIRRPSRFTLSLFLKRVRQVVIRLRICWIEPNSDLESFDGRIKLPFLKTCDTRVSCKYRGLLIRFHFVKPRTLLKLYACSLHIALSPKRTT